MFQCAKGKVGAFALFCVEQFERLRIRGVRLSLA
jgi:hypothetical protein